MCRKVADSIGHRNYHQVVFCYVVAMFVEHKAALTGQTKQVHASVTQLTGIHTVEVCGILEFCLHDCEINKNFSKKRMIGAKSENCDVNCETNMLGNHCIFAL